MHKLDRVFNRHDVPAGVAVAIVDHGCQRGGFTRARGSDKQDQAPLAHDEIGQNLGETQVMPLRDIHDNEAGNDADLIALPEDIDPETPHAGKRHRQIHFQIPRELLALGIVH